MTRWRGRAGGLTIAILAVVALAAGPAQYDRRSLLLYTREGDSLARIVMPADGRITLRYRNSIYGSLVDEEFSITHDGRFRLIGLAADELAVLEEYYRTEARRSEEGSLRTWRATPSIAVEQRRLLVAATDLGERTLLVDGGPRVELWRLVDDARPSVWIELGS